MLEATYTLHTWYHYINIFLPNYNVRMSSEESLHAWICVTVQWTCVCSCLLTSFHHWQLCRSLTDICPVLGFKCTVVLHYSPLFSSLTPPGQSKCPAYPTELVFGLDMSKDVARAAFERQRTALLSLLEDISIAESNCPTGARVAVVGYNDQTKYLIRFQDYRHKTQLNDSVRNITPGRTSDRHLGAAMRFVGQNVFKRSRAGALMRKVAVFFSNGETQNINDIISAVMEYRALNIIPVVISLSGDPDVRRAMEVGLICQQSSVAS